MSGKQVSVPDKTEGKSEVDGDGPGVVSDAELTRTAGTELDSSDSETHVAGTDSTADSDEPDETGADDSSPAAAKGALAWFGRRWGTVLVVLVLIASAAGAGSVYWWMYRPDQQTTAAAQQQVLDAAKQGTTSLLSYAPDTLDKDLATAKSRLTGEFLKYYSDFTDQIVAPAARQKGVKTEATIVRAAVSEMHPDRAVVLVFVNQVTTSKDRPEPALATSSVMVTLVKSQGNWLISEFKPV